ncbi:MAG: hypothetical protein HKN41_12155 [Ilumatobacter sp.]|nr:hypothetical protein [Ilumatobacter sp.]
MDRDELQDKTKEELQDLARERDVAVSGTKDEIVDRLLEDDGDEAQEGSRQGGGSKGSSMRQVLGSFNEQFSSMLGLQVEMVTTVKKQDDGWHVQAQVVEQRRIPPSSDVIGIYDAELDGSGELTSVERTRRSTRAGLQQ